MTGTVQLVRDETENINIERCDEMKKAKLLATG
jgi:hypothetical protein